MSDSNSNTGQAAGGVPGSGYGLPNQSAPLPRQWQQRGLAPQPAIGKAGVEQQFHPGAVRAADWQLPMAGRTSERAILVGLWLLVMLVALAIGLRLLDLSALTVRPADLAARPVAAGAADAARAAAYAAVMDDPLFDDPVPAPASMPLTEAPIAAPIAAARPGVGLAAAAALSPAKPDKPAPAVIAQTARPGDACPDALRAMQLCAEQRR